jgi:hypothetical protein
MKRSDDATYLQVAGDQKQNLANGGNHKCSWSELCYGLCDVYTNAGENEDWRLEDQHTAKISLVGYY